MDTDLEEAQPFKSLTDLYANINQIRSWPGIVQLRECAEYVYRGSEVSVRKEVMEKVIRENQPKTLVCHDMKGGYLEDRFLYGSNDYKSYTFYHWNVIDIFVYFSHYFITIPPLGWINAAHRHGVKVLGTVITEHTDGESIWTEILESVISVRKFANALVEVAKVYKFEGWLLNIENHIPTNDIDKLIYFVKYLTDRIHEEIEGSEVIWYDSVTISGKLKWQNEVNENNKDYFLACDGIFLNYNWTESRLSSSYSFAQNNQRSAFDIYVGLDVWGRDCPGGGGFNSAYALNLIRQYSLSVAIFAPGWTHEYFGSKTFTDMENIFWAQLFPFFYIHVPIYDNEEFETSFCNGAGRIYYHHGEKPQISVVLPQLMLINTIKSNSDVTLENSQKPEVIVFETGRLIFTVRGKEVSIQRKAVPQNINCFEFSNIFSYNGGRCLKLITHDTKLYHRLFLMHIEFQQEMEAIIIYKGFENNDLIESYRTKPILILKNETGLQSIQAEKNLEISNKWNKCIYTTNLRTINEIGIAFSTKGICYLGDIVLRPKQRNFSGISYGGVDEAAGY
ncbi:cytosolic endo-beta-N-acetylglucosaminidase isoform X2 [Prorops nasuta]|uniref:cytosolic endo-beta-N-acetylglucosaminidase isoform X2 n=1 Tax=Prorops nasuta TaxID=863751 RepID=UPI0034CDAFDD